jgi:tellurite resistance protein TehA-like permease
MNEQLIELRELMLSAPGSRATQIVALIVSLLLLAVVLTLVRRRKLREEFTPIWVAVAFGIAIVGVNADVLRGVSRAIGAWTVSSTVFFLGEIFLVAICLNYAVRLSQASVHIKNLTQEVALLRARVDDLERVSESPLGG